MMLKPNKKEWLIVDKAFKMAIKQKRLSKNPKSPRFAENYMYMGKNFLGIDDFKHYRTRKYIK